MIIHQLGSSISRWTGGDHCSMGWQFFSCDLQSGFWLWKGKTRFLNINIMRPEWQCNPWVAINCADTDVASSEQEIQRERERERVRVQAREKRRRRTGFSINLVFPLAYASISVRARAFRQNLPITVKDPFFYSHKLLYRGFMWHKLYLTRRRCWQCIQDVNFNIWKRFIVWEKNNFLLLLFFSLSLLAIFRTPVKSIEPSEARKMVWWTVNIDITMVERYFWKRLMLRVTKSLPE